MSSKDNPTSAIPNGPNAYPLWQRSKAKQVSELLPDVLSDVIARKSGMTLDLLAGWEDVIGPDYAGCTRPEKILWPRHASEFDAFESGTLVVACEGAKALFFQHETAQILERINRFFGFQAIGKIKLVQKPIRQTAQSTKTAQPVSPMDKARLSKILEQINDPDLKTRLQALGEGVYSRKNDAKAAK